MAYNTAVSMQKSQSLQERITAAVAAENFTPNPREWTRDQMWFLVVASDWQVAWAQAQKQSDNPKYNPDIGARDDIITDIMILGGVQARKAYLDSLEPEPAP
jgi:hypothetical protein